MSNLDRINRFLSLLSRINRAIVRAESPDGLYHEACRIMAESGLFRYAWIGLRDPHSELIRPMAHGGVLADVTGSVEALGQAALAVLQGQTPLICNDLNTAGSDLPACCALRAGGLQSMAGLPLREADQVIGVLLLYSDQVGAFDADVVNLLTEVADDISFSLGHMHGEQQRQAARVKLHYLAFYDAQTGLPNRAMLDQRLPRLVAQAEQRGSLLTMLDIKLRRMDQVVQILGNLAMDDVLRTLAQRLEACCSDNSLVVQLAPDEFAMASVEQVDSATIDVWARQVRAAVSEPVRCDGTEVFLQAGIGVAVYPLHESDIRYLLRRARAAAERPSSDDGYRLYSADLDHGLEQRVQMEAELHRALDRNEFVVHYQPQLNLRTGLIVGVEALLRWQHPVRGLVAPGHFIPLLEEAGLMVKVGTWVLRQACRQAKAWQDAGHPPLRMAVNFSAQQFRVANLVATVRTALEDSGLPAEFLELELTESLILESAEQTIQMMHALKALGVSLSLDDFGTGYSSLSYLRRYPVDRIKIDQSFICDITKHPSSAALVRSILAMASNLGLQTIAEGVETAGQLGYLRKQLCEEMQGFLYSHALPPQGIAQLLMDGAKLPVDETLSQAGHTLLIVDDEPNVLTALRRVLRKESWLTLTAPNARDGLELLATREVGVVISDQRMAGTSGTDFLHVVKEMYPDTIRMLLTGYADFSTVIDAVNRGDLYKVLSKPIDDVTLRETIHEAFRCYEVFAENRRLMQRVELLEKLSLASDANEEAA